MFEIVQKAVIYFGHIQTEISFFFSVDGYKVEGDELFSVIELEFAQFVLFLHGVANCIFVSGFLFVFRVKISNLHFDKNGLNLVSTFVLLRAKRDLNPGTDNLVLSLQSIWLGAEIRKRRREEVGGEFCVGVSLCGCIDFRAGR